MFNNYIHLILYTLHIHLLGTLHVYVINIY